MISPLPGVVAKVFYRNGDKVDKGDVLMIMDAMKMEHEVLSPYNGYVKEVYFEEGDRVEEGVDLLFLKAIK